MQINITVPPLITIPEKIICYGISGLDSPVVDCKTDPYKTGGGNITISKGFDKRDISPPLVRLTFESLFNPETHSETKSFGIHTFTHDGYGIDYVN